MFFYTQNLATQNVQIGNPWEFQPTEKLTARIRGDKEDRQAFYQNPETKHCFYSGIEGLNPALRPGKENEPHKIHAFAADYDVKVPDETVDAAVKSMRIKPSWVERSLGGNVRLVWLLAQPLLVGDYAFCAYVLEQAKKWLHLDLLPALDEPAFTNPSRLLCNGCAWRATGAGEIPLPELQSFFFDCGKSYRFKAANEVDIPFDLVEKACREKFPKMDWPGIFEPEAQGPSFWIPESTSPASAIIKQTGIVTFSAHATKTFYTWADILGAEFVREFSQSSVTKATAGVYWDGTRFHRQINGGYCSFGQEEASIFFKVDCGMSSKPTKGGASPIDTAKAHIFSNNRVKGAVPFTFRPSGLITFNGDRVLNTYMAKAMQPAVGTQKWGPHGNFPTLSAFLENLFDPVEQLMRFLAWYQYYYRSALNQVPLPGQNLFLAGLAGSGKTLVNRRIVGTTVGGFVDASDHLVNGSTFTSHLMHVPHWCLDDDTPSNSPAAQTKLQAMFKKTAANQQMLYNKKFEQATMGEWMGRIGCTTNLDFVSTRIMGTMDDSSADKTLMLRCSAKKFAFPHRLEMDRILTAEIPFFLRYLDDLIVPDFVERDARYGYVAYQEPLLLERTHQTSHAAPFRELLIETLHEYFAASKESPHWKGTSSQLMKLMNGNPLNEGVMKSYKLDNIARYLEQIQREGLFKCTTETGSMKTRIWVFYNENYVEPVAQPEQVPTTVENFV